MKTNYGEAHNREMKLGIYQQKYKIAIIVLLLASTFIFLYYFRVVVHTNILFTHYFYIPIVLASLWWKRKGIIVAIALAGAVILCDIFFGTRVISFNNVQRAFMFVLVGSIVAMLGEHLETEFIKRKQVEGRIKHLNSMLRGLRDINQLISRETDRRKLLQGICDSLLENGGYYTAWIALFNKHSKVTVITEAGLGKDFLKVAEMLKQGELPSCGQRTLSQSNIVITENPFSTCANCPLSDKYNQRVAMTARLEYREKIYGLICVSIGAHLVCNEEEQFLFRKVTQNIAFVLHNLELEKQHKRVQTQALRRGAVLDGINKVFRETLTCDTDEEVAKACLTVAQELTRSKLGFIAEVNQAGRLNTIAMSDLGWEPCKMPETDVVRLIKNMEVCGYIGKVLREGKSLIVNNPSSQPKQVGIPEGHPVITSWLGVPLKHMDKTSGIIALANKESGYGLSAQRSVETLSVAFVEALNRKRAEAALRESETKYRILVEYIPAVIYTAALDAASTTLYVSPQIEWLLGFTQAEYQEDPDIWRKRLHPGDRERVLREVARSHESNEPFISEYRMLARDGHVVWFRDEAVVVHDIAGKPLYLQGVMLDVTERKQVEKKLRDSREQFRNLTMYLQEMREQERTSIAREIHDDLGQIITALHMDVSWLKRKLPQDQKVLIDKTQSMLETIEIANQGVKKISTDLRPAILDDLGLAAAMEWQVEQFQCRTGIACILSIEPEDIALTKAYSTAIFRVFQETLTNVARHADATRVEVDLKEQARQVILKVSDNGKGITQEEITNPQSFGLIGIRERVHVLGGTLELHGVRGKGTTITVTL